jgi:hypothetical protein
MLKYVFNVFDKDTGEKKAQVIAAADSFVDTIKKLNEIGMVKAYLIDDSQEVE